MTWNLSQMRGETWIYQLKWVCPDWATSEQTQEFCPQQQQHVMRCQTLVGSCLASSYFLPKICIPFTYHFSSYRVLRIILTVASHKSKFYWIPRSCFVKKFTIITKTLILIFNVSLKSSVIIILVYMHHISWQLLN